MNAIEKDEIEEIALVICDVKTSPAQCKDCLCNGKSCMPKERAKKLYKEGYRKQLPFTNEDCLCILCGEQIPEGRQICPICENKYC